MADCIFCKIAMKQIPAEIVYEDEDTIAFLDINPRSKGMCVVVPKKHFLNFDENFELASELFDKAMIVGEKIKKSLNPMSISFSIMPAQVPHFHIRVYPVYKDQIPIFENKPLEITKDELNFIANKIRSTQVNWKGRQSKIIEKPKEEPKQEKKEEKERSEEDIYWMKRQMDIG
jgi:histidine triad (HIT) family protein